MGLEVVLSLLVDRLFIPEGGLQQEGHDFGQLAYGLFFVAEAGHLFTLDEGLATGQVHREQASTPQHRMGVMNVNFKIKKNSNT